jgi:hypothetical protein
VFELTPQEKYEIVLPRCQQLAADRYAQELNLLTLRAQAQDEATLAAVLHAEQAIAVLDKALAALAEEIERIERSAQAQPELSRNGSARS